jgi:hypothetical protein
MNLAVVYFGFWTWNLEGPLIISTREFGPNTLPSGHRERPMRNKITIEQKWRQESEAYKNEAQKLPYGRERDALLRKARQLETASQINQWLSSPELRPPE